MGQARRQPWNDAFRDEITASSGGRPELHADRFAGLDKVIRFALSPKEQQPDPLPDGRGEDGLTHHNWSAALDLVRKASNAIRVTESRNQEMEARIQGLMRRASQELEAAEARIQASEARANEAEARASEAEARAAAAEEWLRRLHEAITEGFHPRRVEAQPREPAQGAK